MVDREIHHLEIQKFRKFNFTMVLFGFYYAGCAAPLEPAIARDSTTLLQYSGSLAGTYAMEYGWMEVSVGFYFPL